MDCFRNNDLVKASRADNKRSCEDSHPLPIDPDIRQIHHRKIHQKCSSAEGVLKENIVLVLVVRHQIHQYIGNQQDISLVSPCQQRQPKERKERHGNEIQLFGVYAFINSFHRIQDHRFDNGQQ